MDAIATDKLKQPILCAATDGTSGVNYDNDPATANGSAVNGTSAPAHGGNSMNGKVLVQRATTILMLMPFEITLRDLGVAGHHRQCVVMSTHGSMQCVDLLYVMILCCYACTGAARGSKGDNGFRMPAPPYAVHFAPDMLNKSKEFMYLDHMGSQVRMLLLLLTLTEF